MRPPALSDRESYATTLHDMRAPLSSINGYASLLLTGELGKLSSRQQEPVERIQDLCGSLTTLIGNLLTLARGRAERVPLSTVRQYVDLGQVARQAIQSLQGEVRRKKLRLVSHLPAKPAILWGQAGEFAQILLNLLSNAVKFTPPGGKISLEISRRPRKVVIRVVDTGVGMPPEELPKIFRQFYHRDHPETGATPGSGLGLTIVKRMVNNYKGRISVTSRVGRGSQFRVTLPIRSGRQIVQEHLSQVWTQSREADRATGLLLLQVRSKSPRAGKFVESLSRALRGCLRREDQVFILPDQSVVAVLGHIKVEGFDRLVQRLEQSLQRSCARRSASQGEGLPWSLAGGIAPRGSGASTELLDRVRRRMRRVSQGRDGRWSSESNS